MSYLRTIGIKYYNSISVLLTSAPSAFNTELGRRNAVRGRNSFQWFMPEEAATAEALAKMIIPSEEGSPGIEEVSIFGPSAITLLDKLIKASPESQLFYSRGLLSFDIWAVKQYRHEMAELSTEQQAGLFRVVQQAPDICKGSQTPVAKMRRRFHSVMQARKGLSYAAMLCPMLRDHCLQIFYTSRVSWTWLEYDGPPMEKGYPSVVRPR